MTIKDILRIKEYKRLRRLSPNSYITGGKPCSESNDYTPKFLVEDGIKTKLSKKHFLVKRCNEGGLWLAKKIK